MSDVSPQIFSYRLFPGNRLGAISMTYDDNVDPQLDHAMPDLEAHGLRGTFFVVSRDSGLSVRAADWRAAATRGHEIANHTQFHPCSGKFPWVKPENALELYDQARMEKELRGASADLVQLLKIEPPRTYAYTCCQPWVGPQQESYQPLAGRLFAAARNGGNQHADPRSIDFANVPAFIVSKSHTLADIKGWIDLAIQSNRWLVLCCHGVGGGHGIDVEREVHQSLCSYIEERRKHLYCDTFGEIAQYLRKATGQPWTKPE